MLVGEIMELRGKHERVARERDDFEQRLRIFETRVRFGFD